MGLDFTSIKLIDYTLSGKTQSEYKDAKALVAGRPKLYLSQKQRSLLKKELKYVSSNSNKIKAFSCNRDSDS